MSEFIPPLEILIEHFQHLPGIGRKTAQRLAFSIVDSNEEDVLKFAEALVNATKNITTALRAIITAKAVFAQYAQTPKKTGLQFALSRMLGFLWRSNASRAQTDTTGFITFFTVLYPLWTA